MKILVAIPAFNEESSVKQIINQVKSDLPQAEILVIDDGSEDKTAEIALASNVRVVILPFNVGVGGAIRTAFKFAAENSFTHVIQIDADGQHIPKEANKLISAVEPDSIVIGSRFRNQDSNYEVSFARRLAMRILANVVGKICATRLTDVTSGFRISSGKAIELFAKEYPRDYLGDTVESLIIAHNSGIKVIEIPVNMKHREFGNPSQNFLKSLWYLFRALLVVFLSLLDGKIRKRK